jgi:hypothetical protein
MDQKLILANEANTLKLKQPHRLIFLFFFIFNAVANKKNYFLTLSFNIFKYYTDLVTYKKLVKKLLNII